MVGAITGYLFFSFFFFCKDACGKQMQELQNEKRQEDELFDIVRGKNKKDKPWQSNREKSKEQGEGRVKEPNLFQ